MKIAIPKERLDGEKRCAAAPDTVKKYIKDGFEVKIEQGAGEGSSISDVAFKDVGASMGKNTETTCRDADIVLCVNAPTDEQLEHIHSSTLIIGSLAPLNKETDLARYAGSKHTSFAMELLPRISRAQSMDVLSSQSNLAGYRAVIDAVAAQSKATPMMMTAAGTVPPAKAFILGAGVAGLQAIATAKRLGAVVLASDVRPAVKEQVESLGGKFLVVDIEDTDGEDSGGYAKEMSDDYKKRQAELVAEAAAKQDIIITTALIPGRPAPELVSEAMVASMKAGSVIVDLAAPAGGNCALTQPGEVTITDNGVTIIGHTNYPSRCAADATPLYARNLYNFVSNLMLKDSALDVQWDDELITGTLLTKDGELVHRMVKEARNV